MSIDLLNIYDSQIASFANCFRLDLCSAKSIGKDFGILKNFNEIFS